MKSNEHYTKSKGLHLNYSIIADMIQKNASVLDLGCGYGTLMEMLDSKGVKVCGVEINQEKVIKTIEKGLSVIQGNIDEGLSEYPGKFYDYVILNQTLQSTYKPELVINEMLRVGEKVLVSFPNFGYWKIRFYLFFKGKMPKSSILPFEWYDTPNIHLLTVDDFFEFARKRNIKIEETIYMTKAKKTNKYLSVVFPNFFAEEVIFVISR